MAVLTLSPASINQNTYIIDGEVKNQDGDPQVPSSLSWTLTDLDGNIINNREEVTIVASDTFHIVLYGDDLNIEDSYTRVITVDGEYDSIEYGNNLPVRVQAQFNIGEWITPEETV